jgi:hypothetical protein
MTTPAGLLIESLFLPRDAVPTDVVRTVVIPDRFDDVRSFSIAALAAVNLFVFSRNHVLFAESYHVATYRAEREVVLFR